MTLGRQPLASTRPVVTFAAVRLLIPLTSLVGLAVLGFPHERAVIVVTCVLGIPWSVAMLVLATRAPHAALNPLVAAGDLAVLVTAQLVVPELYGALRFVALFLIAAHAHFQGERRGLLIAAGGIAALLATTAIARRPIRADLLALYEVVFAICSIAAAIVVGRLRASESAERLRTEELAARTLDAEQEIRRRVASSIHDGPVQGLASLDLALAAIDQATEVGDIARARRTLEDARALTADAVSALRDEIVSLGPHARGPVSFAAGVERCAPVWRRRYGIGVEVEIERLDLPSPTAAALFAVAQEAVVNAGRHAHASTVRLALRSVDHAVELRIRDDGRGFGEVDPEGAGADGHIGLPSMRERVAMLGGRLRIATGPHGSEVIARLPSATGERDGRASTARRLRRRTRS